MKFIQHLYELQSGAKGGSLEVFILQEVIYLESASVSF